VALKQLKKQIIGREYYFIFLTIALQY